VQVHKSGLLEIRPDRELCRALAGHVPHTPFLTERLALREALTSGNHGLLRVSGRGGLGGVSISLFKKGVDEAGLSSPCDPEYAKVDVLHAQLGRHRVVADDFQVVQTIFEQSDVFFAPPDGLLLCLHALLELLLLL